MPTYATLVRDAASQLEEANIETPQREARLLVALAAGFDTVDLIAREYDEVPADVRIILDAYLDRRKQHEPFAHIAGRKALYGLDFICDARALVPRPDSEIVIETALELLPHGRDLKIADLGTGSGCLLIAVLSARRSMSGVGIEKDAAAASLARENIKRHQLETRADILVSDWGAWTEWSDMDLILSNPPYIASGAIETLAPDVRLYDPVKALDGGQDGLQAYRILTELAGVQMKPGAWLVFEIGYDQDQAVRALMQGHGFVEIAGARDLGGRDRVVFGRRP